MISPPLAPQCIIDLAGGPAPPSKRNGATAPPEGIDQERARRRAIEYLENHAEPALEGAGGDSTTYRVAARVKDFGVDALTALELMLDHWNEQCQPPWATDELAAKVEHAYRYGTQAPGSAAPEVQFDVVPADGMEDAGPVLAMNTEYALVQAGGGHRILWETTDKEGRPALFHLAEQTFHRIHAADVMLVGTKQRKVSELWVTHPQRRTYKKGLVFMPGVESAPEGYYNLWRGWSVEPLPAAGGHASREALRALDDWCGHVLENVCSGNQAHYEWVMSFFAAIVQRPRECNTVALVMRGGKGVGKNATLGPVVRLLGAYASVVSDRRYVMGNFNSHLERCLLLGLDEAVWSGDKAAEGKLKDLITGDQHAIEHKGKEMYEVDNLTRVAILGNEDWVVPASLDERRFAVFDVAEGRKQDVPFFRAMARDMSLPLLLRWLLDWEQPEHVDLNTPPATSGLANQKLESLGAVGQWWFTCLEEGHIVGGDFDGWPVAARSDRLRDAFTRWAREQGIKVFRMNARKFGENLRAVGAEITRERRREGSGERTYFYVLPGLNRGRSGFTAIVGVHFEPTGDSAGP